MAWSSRWLHVASGQEGARGAGGKPEVAGLLPQARFPWLNLRSGRGGTIPENHLNSHHFCQVLRRDRKHQVG